MLQTVSPPALVPLLPTSFAQITAPLPEDRFFQPREVAMLLVIWVRKTPREFAANNVRFVEVRADDGHG